MKNTIAAIQNLTGKKVVRVTELPYVVVAVFESGRPQFISKNKIVCEVFQWDCGWMSEAFSKEWSIKPAKKVVKIAEAKVNPDAAYELAVSLGCRIREDWWTPKNREKAKIVISRPTDQQLESLKAADSNWDCQWGVYKLTA